MATIRMVKMMKKVMGGVMNQDLPDGPKKKGFGVLSHDVCLG